MQKYIAVISPKNEKDELSKMIAGGIAGALFSISHQNYPMALKMIRQVKDLSRKHNRPVSLIQDICDISDPLDLELGLRGGIDWVVLSTDKQYDLAKKMKKTIPVIWKGKGTPKKLKVDSIMVDQHQDPDASVEGQGHIKHQFKPHIRQSILEAIKHMSDHANASGIVVSDLEEAKSLSGMRPKQKIIFAPKDRSQAPIASIYWGVHPIFGQDIHSYFRKGERMVDARNPRHVTIKTA